jgi:hypothetical protein
MVGGLVARDIVGMRSLILVVGLLLPALVGAQTPIQTGSIKGWVGDTVAAPLEGANITAAEATGEKVSTVRSDRSGQFVFDRLTPGPFVITVELAGFPRYEAHVYVGAGRTTHVATMLSVGWLAKVVVAPSIRGVVLDPSGQPIAGAWVRAISIAPVQVSRDDSVVVTDASGQFELSVDLHRMCLVLAIAPGHMGTAVGFGNTSPDRRVDVRLQRLTTAF